MPRRSIKESKMVTCPTLKDDKEAEKYNSIISDRFKGYYDNRDYRPLTIHNFLHSFEKYFAQYTYVFKVGPVLTSDRAILILKWVIDINNILEIQCDRTSFHVRGAVRGSKFESGLLSRKKAMELIKERFKDFRFPVDPH